jgi:ribose transport system substrate-binding protein
MRLPRRAALAAPALLLAANLRPAAAQDGKKPTIAMVPLFTTDAFYVTLGKGAQDAANAIGVNLLYQGSAVADVPQQVNILNAMIARAPDALAIAPADRVQLVAPMRKAFDAKIPIVTVDTYIGETGMYQTGAGPADFPLSYIASDNTEGGRVAARALAKAIGDKGKVFVNNTRPGVSTPDQREAGFREEMKKHPDIEVLQTQYNEGDPGKAAATLSAVLARAPDLAGVFAINVNSGIGTANGVKAAGKTGAVKIAAFDAPEAMVDYIKSGLVDMAIAQHPAEIGWFGVLTAFAAAKGVPVPSRINTGFTVMDKTNIEDPAIRRFVYIK